MAPIEPPMATNKKLDKTSFEEVDLLQLLFFLLLDHYLSLLHSHLYQQILYFLKYFFIIGILGSFTTFSTFSLETIELLVDKKILLENCSCYRFKVKHQS